MMMTKMNRLSIDRLYSVSQPAKNSPAYFGPEIAQTPRPKSTARPMKIADEDAGFLHRGLVRPAADDEDVDGQDRRPSPHGDDPGVEMDVQTGGLPRRVSANVDSLGGLFRQADWPWHRDWPSPGRRQWIP